MSYIHKLSIETGAKIKGYYDERPYNGIKALSITLFVIATLGFVAATLAFLATRGINVGPFNCLAQSPQLWRLVVEGATCAFFAIDLVVVLLMVNLIKRHKALVKEEVEGFLALYERLKEKNSICFNAGFAELEKRKNHLLLFAEIKNDSWDFTIVIKKNRYRRIIEFHENYHDGSFSHLAHYNRLLRGEVID